MRPAAVRLCLLTSLVISGCSGEPAASAGATRPAPPIQPPTVDARGAPDGTRAGSNRARFTYSVDLHGSPGTLVLDVEAIGQSGITWGPGSSPSITGVIATGEYMLRTAGRLQSATGSYVFTGENQFADFTDETNFERFRVQWVVTERGLRLIANPFGPGPTIYECVLTKSELL